MLHSSASFRNEIEARAFAASYLKAYPPQGYMTRVEVIPPPRGAGEWIVQYSRFTAC